MAEEITLTTYYPAPYGAYDELTVTGNVYLEDGTFINAKILEEGYGQVMTIPPDVKYADYFLKLERQARENRKGFWAETDNM